MNEKEKLKNNIELLEDTLVRFWGEIVNLWVKNGYNLDGEEANEFYVELKKAMRWPA